VDGFLQGCRPYIAMDATQLIRRSRGQLVTAVAVDGHNMEDFVHDYFSVERFKKAYEGTFKPMTSQE
jgi:hypothetical protein